MVKFTWRTLVGDTAQRVMNTDELAEYLRLPKTTVYKLVQSGKIPGRKAGRQWRFHRDAIDRWLSEKNEERTGDQNNA